MIRRWHQARLRVTAGAPTERGPVARLLLGLPVLLLIACTPRPTLAPFPASAEPVKLLPIYVTTTRALGDDRQYGARRDAAPDYLRYDIAVPPNRATGDLAAARTQLDPDTTFSVKAAARYRTGAAFESDLRSTLRQLPAPNREALIYVHGFNNTFDQGVLRIAQLSDDFNLDGVSLHYSWPSSASPFGYEYDKDSVLFARDGLEDLITRVRAAGATRILLVGHSLGAQLIVETLRQIDIADPGAARRILDGVVLVSPDIDEEVFRSQLSRIQPLPQPFVIFISRRDRALRLSAWLTGQQDRLGNLGDLSGLVDLSVTVLDVTSFSTGIGHFTLADSPGLIRILEDLGSVDAAFRNDTAGRTGLLPGFVLTIQNATQIILSPIAAIAE